MKTKLILFGLLYNSISFAQQVPDIQWKKALGGGNGQDESRSVRQTTDGGYILAGHTSSDNGDATGLHGGYDFWVIKLNSTGSIQWQKALGGSLIDQARSIQQTTDGGYIVGGITYSNDGDVTGNHGDADAWVVKLSSTGIIEWQKTFGGTKGEEIYSMQQTADGGYVFAGGAQSTDGDVTENRGKSDAWVVKLDETGTIQWQKTFGGSDFDQVNGITQTSDGGYIFTGIIYSTDGDITGNHGSFDSWVVKLSSNGNMQWQKALGGTKSDYTTFVQQTIDGGYILSGQTESNDGDVTGNHGDADVWIVKLSNSGNIQWQKTFGGTDLDYAGDIHQTSDGGYLIAANSVSNNGNVTGNHGMTDFWVVKINSSGELQWQKSLGGSKIDSALSSQQAADGGYIVVGYVYSSNGDVTGYHSVNYANYSDVWVVKFQPEQLMVEDAGINKILNIYPNPATNILNIDTKNKIEKLIISDVTGKKILEQNNDLHQVNIQALPKGTYFIQIKLNGEIKTEKFIKK